jgi:RNA polymerase sigma-70 factor (ECF subfamily)
MIREKFYIFITSSFNRDKKNTLFDYIWNNYRKKISYYMSNFISFNHPLFEDLLQDVMLKIYKNLEHFNPANSFKAWLYTISRNHCIDFLKGKNLKIKNSQNSNFSDMIHNDTPEKNATIRETREKIAACLALLSPQDREIAYLRFYEDLKYKKISTIMNISLDNVKVRIHLIKKKIINQLRGSE